MVLQQAYTPGSLMGKANMYLPNRWDDLLFFLRHGFLPMEHNTTEQAIRPIAVGCKAWLFIGSEDGGSWAATMLSIIESCRLQKGDPVAYCTDTLDCIVQASDWAALPDDEITPKAYKLGQRQRA